MLARISLVCAVSATAASAQAAPDAGPAAVSSERAERVYSPSHSEMAARSAAETSVSTSDHASPDRYWYGWQPLIADVLGAGLLVLGAATEDAGLGALGLGVFVIAAPVLHWKHRNWEVFSGQVGLRLLAGGALVLGYVVKELTADGSGTGTTMLGISAIVGAVATLLDVVLGYGEVRPHPATPFPLTPWADARGNAGLQLTAAF